jgi:hypothetical protein
MSDQHIIWDCIDRILFENIQPSDCVFIAQSPVACIDLLLTNIDNDRYFFLIKTLY